MGAEQIREKQTGGRGPGAGAGPHPGEGQGRAPVTRDYSSLTIGVLALQGAVSEHLQCVARCGARALAVRRSGLLQGVDALIIPGGESTTIGRLSSLYGYTEEIKGLAAAGKPVLGTCAGAIMLAKKVAGQDPLIPLMEIEIVRNAFGRQRESFETELEIPILGAEPFCGVFIRAPLITAAGRGVEVLASYGPGIVFAREKNLLAVAFHPELTEDLRLHRLFLEMALERQRAGRGPAGQKERP